MQRGSQGGTVQRANRAGTSLTSRKSRGRGFAMALLVGSSAFLAACGSSGIEFNGSGSDARINPRSQPLVHFPLPIETFNQQTGAYEIDGAVIAVGRQVPSSKPGQLEWSEPVTAGLPGGITAFTYKSSTDVWEMHGVENRNNPLTPIDLTEFWGGQPVLAAAMSVVCQWMLQQVNGDRRTDMPVAFENVEFQSIDISLIGSVAPQGPTNGSNNQRQSKVSPRIGERGKLQAGEDVVTDNPKAANTAVNMPGTANHIEFAFAANAPGPVLFSRWQEGPQENLFIESMNQTVTDSPTNGYFAASGTATMNGGIYVNRITPSVTPVYNLNINIGFYYAAACLAHVIGCGHGLQQTAFVRPGTENNFEEDVMSKNVEVDQSYYITSGQRMNFTTEGLLHFQNSQRYPLGSSVRSDAALRSLIDPFDPTGLRMGETAPGPRR